MEISDPVTTVQQATTAFNEFVHHNNENSLIV